MYTNDSCSAEKAYDNLYERSEDVKDNTSECSDCQGHGTIEFSSCCGADIFGTDSNFCLDCLQPCDVITEDCETCLGEGEVSE